MILDDKVIMSLPPPPPYLPNQPAVEAGYDSAALSNHPPPPPFSESSYHQHQHQAGRPLKLSSLPSHILLQIVYNSFFFPLHRQQQQQASSLNTSPTVERQRQILLWLTKSLRLVNKAFYIACMHVLRSTYLPSYDSMLRPYYSSDPFPSTAVPQAHLSTLNTVQRETPVLDLFIALKVREDVFVDDSELHLEREDMFKDIFDLAQPRARIEDLVRVYGVKEGVITLSPPGVVTYTSTTSSNSGSSEGGATVVDGRGSESTKLPPLPPPPLLAPCTTTRSPTSRFFSAFMRSPKPPSPPNTVIAPCSRNRTPLTPRSAPQPRRPTAPNTTRIRPLPFALLSVSFGTRKVGLQLMNVGTGSKRTIVEIQRMSRDESLETAATRIVAELKVLLVE